MCQEVSTCMDSQWTTVSKKSRPPLKIFVWILFLRVSYPRENKITRNFSVGGGGVDPAGGFIIGCIIRHSWLFGQMTSWHSYLYQNDCLCVLSPSSQAIAGCMATYLLEVLTSGSKVGSKLPSILEKIQPFTRGDILLKKGKPKKKVGVSYYLPFWNKKKEEKLFVGVWALLFFLFHEKESGPGNEARFVY